jgi:hypothetical protein
MLVEKASELIYAELTNIRRPIISEKVQYLQSFHIIFHRPYIRKLLSP